MNYSHKALISTYTLRITHCYMALKMVIIFYRKKVKFYASSKVVIRHPWYASLSQTNSEGDLTGQLISIEITFWSDIRPDWLSIEEAPLWFYIRYLSWVPMEYFNEEEYHREVYCHRDLRQMLKYSSAQKILKLLRRLPKMIDF